MTGGEGSLGYRAGGRGGGGKGGWSVAVCLSISAFCLREAAPSSSCDALAWTYWQGGGELGTISPWSFLPRANRESVHIEEAVWPQLSFLKSRRFIIFPLLNVPAWALQPPLPRPKENIGRYFRLKWTPTIDYMAGHLAFIPTSPPGGYLALWQMIASFPRLVSKFFKSCL